MKNVIKGGVKKFSKIVFEECYKGWCKNTWKPQVSVTVIISHCFTLFPCVLHFFNLFSIEFVANRALWVALNLSRITHFSCKFLGPKKSACVNVLTYSTSVNSVSISYTAAGIIFIIYMCLLYSINILYVE